MSLKHVIDRLRGGTAIAAVISEAEAPRHHHMAASSSMSQPAAAGVAPARSAAAKPSAEDDEGNKEDELEEDEKDEELEDGEDEEDEDGGPSMSAAASSAANVRATAAAITELCVKAGVPGLAPGLIAAGLPLEEAQAKIANAGEIRHLVGLARKVNSTIGLGLADEYVRNGSTAAEAGRDLLERLVKSQSPEIRNSHTPGSRPAGVSADHGWGAAIRKATGQKEG